VQQFLARAHQAAWGAPLPMPSAHEGEGSLGFGQLRPGLNEAPPPGYFGAAQFLGFLRKKYWVCEASDGSLLALDPHAAFERIHWTAFRAALRERRPQFQRALFSSVVTVNAQVLERLTKHLDALLCLGIELAPFGGTSLALKAVPNALMNADFKWLLEQLAALLPSDETAEGAYHAALKLLACCAAGQGGRLHTPAEIASALVELDGADFRTEISHPSIVLLEAPLFELERKSRAPQKQS
jgi:DNA mismatch repair protein MutL